jgi:methane monooxygenase PmoA-like
MKLRAAIFLCSALSIGLAGAATPLEIQATDQPTAWTVSYRGHKVMVYAFDPQQFKPYVKELYTLKGDNLLRDAPHDHLHHHGLMYAIKVNGINFWEEISGSGVEKVIQTSTPLLTSEKANGATLSQASLSQVIHWLAPQDAFLPNFTPVALLIEHRTLTLAIDPGQQEVALRWKSQFEVGNKTNTVTLTGANYHGLGIRFRQDLDALAAHSLAGARPDLANNRQDVSPAPWAAVSFDAPNRPATIILTGASSNARGQPTFFSMLTPFAYVSATQRLDKEPLVYHTGDKFELNYLVLLYPAVKSSDFINQRLSALKPSLAQVQSSGASLR